MFLTAAYYVLATAFCVYLVHDFSLELRKLIKAFIASQIFGDLVFGGWLSELPVYQFMSKLETSDRFYTLLVIMGCVILMDMAYRLFRPLKRRAVAVRPDVLRASGIMFVLVATLCKVLSLAAADVLFHPLQALSLQPEALVGASFLDIVGSTLFPIGLAFWVLSSNKRRHGVALFCILFFGLMSPWKGDIVRMAACYIFALGVFGWRFVREAILGRQSLVFCAAFLLLLPIKTQLRSTAGASFDARTLATYLVMGTSGRVTGGIFQTFCEVTRNIRDHSSPLMRGRYNLQALYLWVPRMLWPDKPRVAAEQVYDYLDLSEEPYGTSFALTLFGTFYLDFGLWGSLVCSFLFGLVLAAAERRLFRLQSPDPVKFFAMAAIWLSLVFFLSEGGLPPAVSQFLACALAAIVALKVAKWFVLPAHLLHKNGVPSTARAH